MPILTKSAPKKAKKKRMKEEMEKFESGKLHSSSKTGPIVKDKSQAVAISLSEAGMSNRKSKKKKSKK